MNIGVFGGTFDPPHTGHLIAAQDAAVALRLDRVLFIPAAAPPHKRGMPVLAADLRARMLELAVSGDPRFAVDRLELDRPGPSFTVDTLALLRTRYPGAEWTLLVGADQYADFGTWRAPERIREHARIAVLTRAGQGGSGGRIGDAPAPGGGTEAPSATELPGGDVRVDVTRIDISATAVRRRVAAGLSIRYLVPDAVEAFIFEQRLYRRNGVTVTG